MSLRICELVTWAERLKVRPEGAHILNEVTRTNGVYDVVNETPRALAELIELYDLGASRWHEFHPEDAAQLRDAHDTAAKYLACDAIGIPRMLRHGPSPEAPKS